MVPVSTRQGSILVPVELRRSRKARYIRLWVGPENQAVVSVPWNVKFEAALTFLESQGDWLREQLEKQPPRLTLSGYLRTTSFLSAEGRSWPMEFRLHAGATRLDWHREAEQIVLQVNSGAETETQVVRVVREFARSVLNRRTLGLAARLELPKPRIGVRDQASRWGSCSTSGQISLNWRLVLLKPALQDYVIFHELAHITEMNHSPRFWKVLEDYDPLARAHDRELSAISQALIRVGRP